MRRLVVCLLLVLPVPAAAVAGTDRTGFRYERPLLSTGTGGPLVFEPDGPLFAHTQPGFADLRILDAHGEQVPWRTVPPQPAAGPERLPALNSGRRGSSAVALFDLGPGRRVRDRIGLDVPDRGFVGHAVVLGSDRRGGPFTRLSSTGIYDIDGARNARSTLAVFGPSDFRYLLVRATGVRRILGGTVSGARERPRQIGRTPRAVTRVERGSRTSVTLDLGFRNLPVDEIGISARTSRYERAVEISASNDGRHYRPLTVARIFRFAGSTSAPIAVIARERFLRITVDNGDDSPLHGLRVSAAGEAAALMAEGGHPRPYELLYGSPQAGAPSYDLARLPEPVLGLGRSIAAQPGPERPNPAYESPPDTRSLTARHPEIVEGSLALAALALGAAGLFAVRRRV